MSCIAIVRLCDETLIERSFADSTLISCNEKDGSTLWIERKGDPPLPIRRLKAKFLHVGIRRVLQRIDMRSSGLRPEQFNKMGFSEQFILHARGEVIEFRLKVFVKKNSPAHECMFSEAYALSSILCSYLMSTDCRWKVMVPQKSRA